MKPRLFFITLEDLNEVSGQSSRYLRYLPYLSQWLDITLVGRSGPLPEKFKLFFRDRVELPLPPGIGVGRWIVHPAGRSRLRAIQRALANLPSTPNDILYADSVLLGAWSAPSPHKLVVTEVNGALSEEFRHKPGIGGPLLYPWLRRWEANAYDKSDRLIAISRGVENYIKILSPHVADRITVLGNGIEPREFNPQVDGSPIRRERCWGDAPVGIFVSTFRKWHGAHKLVEMLPHVLIQEPDFKLALVGDGPEFKNIQKMVNDLGLSKSVEMPGVIAPDKTPKWVAAATVGLYYPDYHSRYGFLFDPIKLHEYMACAKPTVIIKQDFLGDVLKEADAGIFTDANPESFAQGIINLLNAPEKMNAMGERAADVAQKNHTWESIARGIARVCELKS